MCSNNFWHQQDSNSLFKGSIGHVTSLCKWPISLCKSLTKEAFVVNLSTVNKLYYFPGHDLISGQEVTLGRLPLIFL